MAEIEIKIFRFSVLYARVREFGNRTIEDIYQSSKTFGGKHLTRAEAKGKKADDMPEVARLCWRLWVKYFQENPELLHEIKKYKGFSDMFGRQGCQCQAEVIYAIYLKIKDNPKY